MPSIEFFPETGAAILPIERPAGIMDALVERALNDGFGEKEEFHVTVLPAIPEEDITPKFIERSRQLLVDQVITDIKFDSNSVFQVSKPKEVITDGGVMIFERESIVVQVQSKQLTTLMARLATRGIHGSSAPFWHVTLFTRGDSDHARRGIGIDSWADLMKMNPVRYPDKNQI